MNLTQLKTLNRVVTIAVTASAFAVVAANAEPPPLAALPPVSVPADAPLTPERVELGKLLYFDTRLSGDASVSCASCHNPREGWGDAAAISRGYPGTKHWRNSQTVMNSAYLKAWFWTSSAPTLEKQANSAATGALAGNLKPVLGTERMKQIPAYVKLFKKVYGEAPSYEKALSAISAFERTVVSDDSPFDQYMRGDKNALSTAQLRGKKLFEGKANCIACHNGALLTDQEHYNIGVPPNPEFLSDPQRQIAMRERMASKGFAEEVYLKLDRDPGRFRATKDMADIGKFRTAPLRYIRYTAPYMHNGAFITIEEVVDFYDEGGGDDPFGTKSDKMKPLKLSITEKADLVAFLDSLSGTEVLMKTPVLPKYGVLKFPMVDQW